MGRILDRKSLADEVHDRLVEAMCSGELVPGTVLRQERLAEDLNVSRQPIIQALGMLRRDGLIEPAGRRGYRVAPVDAALVRHVYDLRAVFDGLAARLAAGNHSENRSSVLEMALAAGTAALQQDGLAALVDADIKFHRALYDLSNNPLLPEASAAIWRQVRRVMFAILEKHEVRASIWEEHHEIAAAVLANDADTAERLAVKHANDAAAQFIHWMTEDRVVRIGSIQA